MLINVSFVTRQRGVIWGNIPGELLIVYRIQLCRFVNKDTSVSMLSRIKLSTFFIRLVHAVCTVVRLYFMMYFILIVRLDSPWLRVETFMSKSCFQFNAPLLHC